MGQVVAEKELERIAANDGYRTAVYEELKEMGKEDLFPKRYLNQKDFAKAEIYLYATDESDGDTPKIEFLNEKVAVFKGIQSRFFLFKVTFDYGEEYGKETYLAIAGPYNSSDKRKIESSHEVTLIDFNEEYDPKSTSWKFTDALKSAESREN